MTVVRETKRLEAAVAAFCEKGFHNFLKPLCLQVEALPASEKAAFFRSRQDLLDHFVAAIKELGSPYTDFAHKLYRYSDKLPISWCEAFLRLKSEVAPFPFEKAVAAIQMGLGGRLETYFLSVDKTPSKTTFFSQIYKARLKTGESVLVKVVRPEAAVEVESAFEVVNHVGEQVYRAYDFAKECVVPLLDSLRESLLVELDLELELRERQRLGSLLARDFVVPRVFPGYSSSGVLTWELTTSPKLDSSACQKLLFEFGLILLPQQAGRVFDELEVCTVSHLEREALAQLFIALKEENVFLAIVALQRLSPTPTKCLDEEVEEGLNALMQSEKNRAKHLLLLLSDRNIALNPAAYLALKDAIF